MIFLVVVVVIIALLTPENKCGCYKESIYNCSRCDDYTCSKCKRSGYDKI